MNYLDRLREAYSKHRDFVFVAALFAFLQLMLLAFFAPGGRFGDYSDYWYFEEMASRMDGGYLPYLHYWVEYPPLFPWLPVGAYWLSRLLPPAPHPQLWFYLSFGGLMGLFGVGNLCLVYLLGIQLYGRSPALRCAWFYALLFGPIFVHAGWFDGVALFFMLLSLYLLFKKRAVLGGLAAGLGVMVKILPLALAPVGFKVLARRWRYLAGLGLVILVTNLPFYLLNPVLFLASWRSLLTTPSWETIWALLDGYYSYGLAVGNRFDPEAAGGGQRPEFVPWSAVLGAFGISYLVLYLMPWQRLPADRVTAQQHVSVQAAHGRTAGSRRGPGHRLGWWHRIVDQFRNVAPGADGQPLNQVGLIAFVALSLNLFMIFSRGYSPQFVLWYLPFLVLAMPNGWGLTYATLLTVDSVVERVLYFFVLPDSQWLLVGTVLFRTALMLWLVPEYLSVMGILPRRRWQLVRRWLVVPATLVTLVALGLGTRAFVRDYTEQRYAENSQRHVVDQIRSAALPGDGVVATTRASFDALEPFLPELDVRIYTRDDGEFRELAFEAQWVQFVARHPRVWLMLDYTGGQSADWNVYLAERLGLLGYQTLDEWVGQEQRLVHYATTLPASFRQEEVGAVFASGVELTHITLDQEPLRAGEVLRLSLRWEADGDMAEQHKVFLHLVSGGGQISAQRDVPLATGRSSEGLEKGSLAAGGAQKVGLLLPRDLAPGDYDLWIGVYDPRSGERLVLPAGQDSLVIEGIRVQ